MQRVTLQISPNSLCGLFLQIIIRLKLNIITFLIGFDRFISTEDKKAQGSKRDSEVLIHRRKDGGLTVPYRIIDNPTKLTPDDWYVLSTIWKVWVFLCNYCILISW